MATEIELERTYLLKHLPDGLRDVKSVLIHDIYVPEHAAHAQLRLRHKGDRYEITKKFPTDGTDASKQFEYTIELKKEEFEALAAISKKDLIKRRYFIEIEGRPAELDVYQERLAGLAVIDFEFDDETQMRQFRTPDIALADVTRDEMIAAGLLSGKSIDDILPILKERYGYKKLE